MPSCWLSVIASASAVTSPLLDDVVAEAAAGGRGVLRRLLRVRLREQAGLDQHLAEALA